MEWCSATVETTAAAASSRIGSARSSRPQQRQVVAAREARDPGKLIILCDVSGGSVSPGAGQLGEAV